jgi:Flp pilus assembly protein TadD
MDELEASLAVWRKAVGLRPNSPSAHAGLGRTLLDTGRRDEAVRHLRHAVSLAPEMKIWREWLDAATNASGASSNGL